MAPNQRQDGWRTSTYSAPAALIAEAKAKATAEDTDLSAVIRAALEQYIAR